MSTIQEERQKIANDHRVKVSRVAYLGKVHNVPTLGSISVFRIHTMATHLDTMGKVKTEFTTKTIAV